jgi:hypothetical protein
MNSPCVGYFITTIHCTFFFMFTSNIFNVKYLSLLRRRRATLSRHTRHFASARCLVEPSHTAHRLASPCLAAALPLPARCSHAMELGPACRSHLTAAFSLSCPRAPLLHHRNWRGAPLSALPSLSPCRAAQLRRAAPPCIAVPHRLASPRCFASAPCFAAGFSFSSPLSPRPPLPEPSSSGGGGGGDDDVVIIFTLILQLHSRAASATTARVAEVLRWRPILHIVTFFKIYAAAKVYCSKTTSDSFYLSRLRRYNHFCVLHKLYNCVLHKFCNFLVQNCFIATISVCQYG